MSDTLQQLGAIPKTKLTSKNKYLNKFDIAFIIFLLGGLIFLFWKAPYGFGNSDESFYLTVPYRLTMGDSLLAQEWHLSQLAGFLLYPIMQLFMWIVGTTEGIILNFRYIYIVAQCLFTIYIYIRLRRKSHVAGIVCGLVFLLYTPFNIMALSYNSMGIMFFVISTVTMVTIQKRNFINMIIAGLSFACSVLCCPYLIFVYLIYAIAAVFYMVLHKNDKKISALLDKNIYGARGFLGFTCGAAILAVAFAGFVLSRASVSDILASLPIMFNDPEHVSVPFTSVLNSYITAVSNISNTATPVLVCSAILAIIILIDKNRVNRRGLYMIGALILTIVYTVPFVTTNRYVNFLMMPINILGFFAFLLCQKKHNSIFQTMWIAGFLYGFCVHYSSNQRFYVISSVATISALASIFFIVSLAREMNNSSDKFQYFSRAVAMAMCLTFFFQIAYQINFRYQYVFWDNSPNLLNQKIDFGPEKGIKTTVNLSGYYKAVMKDTEKIRNQTGGPVLYFSMDTWLYMADSKEMGAYSAWLSFLNSQNSANNLLDYYKLYPEKTPKYIYVNKNITGAEAIANQLNTQNKSIEETTLGYVITN